jgi:uncharacterized membrane protein YkvA (DUF1232 family)
MAEWILVGVAASALVYAVFIALLIIGGRRAAARAVAGVVPDFVVLFRGLLGDPRVPRRRKLVLAAVLPYLALPFDLVPDFVPVAGYLDDAVVVALALRYVLRGTPRGMIEEHWHGPPSSLAVVLKLAAL